MDMEKTISKLKQLTLFSLLIGSFNLAYALSPGEEDYELKLLGKFAFFDDISDPTSEMSCASCHDPRTGFTGPDSAVNAQQVAMTGATLVDFGTLKPPSAAYASFIAPFDGRSGGNFWDGRARGTETPSDLDDTTANATRHVGEEVFFTTSGCDMRDSGGDCYNEKAIDIVKYVNKPITDQALNPMPNPVEQNISRQGVCEHVAASEYAELYEKVWGGPILCDSDAVSVQPADQLQYVEILPPVVDEDGNYICVFGRRNTEFMRVPEGEDCPSFVDDQGRTRNTSPLLSEEAILNPDVSPNPIPLALDTNMDISFKRVITAISAYEHSSDFNQFSSKRDKKLRAELECMADEEACAAENPEVFNDPDYFNSKGGFPLAGFTLMENKGHDLAYNITSGLNPEGKRGGCGINCHRSGADPDGLDLDERYTDDRFHNIGTPFNPEIGVVTGQDLGPDVGLQNGQHKTPTLRNVDRRPTPDFVKAYGHNGWFKSMESIMHFYNTSNLQGSTAAGFGITQCPEDPDNKGYTPEGEMLTETYALANNCWPAPGTSGPIPRGGADAIGDLGLSLEEEAAIVAYMKTLSDQKQVRLPNYGDLVRAGIKPRSGKKSK